MQNLSVLQKNIGYNFNDLKLLKLALTHASYANEHNINKYETNQRLEFLGDAVLELLSSDFLYKKYSHEDEGYLTRVRAKLVCEDSLSKIARQLNLYDYLVLGKGENAQNVKCNNSIMCDTLEALIGAIYLDSSIINAETFVNRFILTDDNLSMTMSDYKSLIQEKANHDKVSLKYEVVRETGPDHDKSFYVKINYNNEIIEEGFGKSKKEAEQAAAKVALEKIL